MKKIIIKKLNELENYFGKTYDYLFPFSKQKREDNELIYFEPILKNEPFVTFPEILNRPFYQTQDNILTINNLVTRLIKILTKNSENIKCFIDGFDNVEFEYNATGFTLTLTPGSYILNDNYIDFKYYVEKGKLLTNTNNIYIEHSYEGATTFYINLDETGNIIITNTPPSPPNLYITIGKITRINDDEAIYEDLREETGFLKNNISFFNIKKETFNCNENQRIYYLSSNYNYDNPYIQLFYNGLEEKDFYIDKEDEENRDYINLNFDPLSGDVLTVYYSFLP